MTSVDCVYIPVRILAVLIRRRLLLLLTRRVSVPGATIGRPSIGHASITGVLRIPPRLLTAASVTAMTTVGVDAIRHWASTCITRRATHGSGSRTTIVLVTH